MREMKDSGIEWIGEIPADWAKTRIGNLFRFSSGDSLTNEEIQDEGLYKVYGANGPRGYYHHTNIAGKHILIGRVGALCGNIHVVDEPVWVTEHALIAEQISPGVLTDFAARVFESMNLGQYSKASAQPVIASSVVQRLQIPIPPSLEQRRIADYLDRKCSQIDAIIARQQEVIEKLKDYKLSIITEAVTKGLNPDVPMKDSGVEWIGEIPDFWNVVPLKTCSDILPGYAFSSNDFDTENGTALLRGINVTPNGVRWEDVVYWNKPITEQLRAFELVAGDIVVGLDRPWVSGGTRVCWVTQKDLPALLLQRVCRIRAKENIDSRWIYHWIASKSFQEALSIETTGVSVPHISTKQIGQFSITLPPIEVQHQICDTLETKCYSIDKIADKKQAIIDKLTEYKKSLIYEDVTGKKEV